MSLFIDCNLETVNTDFSADLKESSDSFASDFGENIGGGVLLPATKDRLGGVIIGSGITITAGGIVSVDTADVIDNTITKPITSAGVANSALTNLELEALLK